ncbi:phage virion morphogenesis protein [Porphyromonas endodontalis]|uniref:phage virion morphogenesis protein n=1 Tax=Porphyromonas endodontalis TaxID=28124 RepID=UPI003FA0B1E4
MDLDKLKIEVALARELALLMEQETTHTFRTKQRGGRAWKPSNISANLLISSSVLRNSIHHTAVGNQVEVSSPLPYANIHNQGGRIPITDRMRGYF